MTRIMLFGAGGRMGRSIAALAAGRDDVEIVTERPDVLVDFSEPDALEEHPAAAVPAESIMPRCAAARSRASISQSLPATASGSSSATAPRAGPSSRKARSGRRPG